MDKELLIQLLEQDSEAELTLIQNYILDRVIEKMDGVNLENLVERAVTKKLEELAKNEIKRPLLFRQPGVMTGKQTELMDRQTYYSNLKNSNSSKP